MIRLLKNHLPVFVICLGCIPASCRKEPPPPPPPGTGPTTARGETAPASAPSAGNLSRIRAPFIEPTFDHSRWKDSRSALLSAAAQALAEVGSASRRHIAAGIHALDRGDNTTAAGCFRSALKLDPDHQGALHGLSEALVGDKKYDEVAKVYRQILRLSPDDRVSRFNLAVVESRLRRFDRAEELYRSLLVDDEDHVKARYNLATLYQHQGKLAAAHRTWMEVLARAPHLASGHTALGEVLTDLGDHRGAMDAYARAGKLRPKEADAWVNLAAAAQAAGSYGTALGAMRNALDLAPLDADLWAQQGKIQLDLHRRTGKSEFLREAIASWRKGIQLDPDRKDIREWLHAHGSGPDRAGN